MKKLLNYFQGVKTELKKVTWPTKTETKDMTLLVLVVSVVWATYIWLLDVGFSQLLGLIIKQ